jgi:hypothetical protein
MATAHATLRRRSGQAGLARVIADIRREVAATALLAAACIALGATAAAQDPRREHRTFEDAAAGAPPPGFSSALTGRGGPAHWVVLEDPSSPTGAKVVAETSQDRTSDRFPLAILDGFEARDVAVLVRFRPVSGTVDQAAGLVVRLRDSRNYYVARANALEGNVRLYRVVDGRRTQFAGVGTCRCRATAGRRSGCGWRATASRSRSRGGRCSPPPTAPSATRAGSASGPRPTA